MMKESRFPGRSKAMACTVGKGKSEIGDGISSGASLCRQEDIGFVVPGKTGRQG
jgi:hypothetical protein